MKYYGAIVFGLMISLHSYANIRLPSLVSNNMVLQRDKPLKIWGWADAAESVKITFLGKKYTAATSQDGKWNVAIPAQKAGGPYNMVLVGHDTITLNNILIGDVWFCGGQSNMEVKMTNALNPDKEVAAADNPNIRLFDVAHAGTALPAGDVKGKWQECNPVNTKNFSAVAYYFARNIQPEIKVPIGLIECAFGGTAIQAWISPEGMAGDPVFGQRATQLQFVNLDSIVNNSEAAYYKWVVPIDHSDPGYTNGTYEWAKQPHPEWPVTYFPGTFEGAPLYPEMKDGITWLSKTISLTDADIAANCILNLGIIEDDGLAFVNGTIVGSTRNEKNNTLYEVDKTMLHTGDNYLTVRIMDFAESGGMYGKAGMPLSFKTPAKNIPLSGMWNYKMSLDTTFANRYKKLVHPVSDMPSVLFNAMIAPLTPYSFKGFLWYQGESNTFEAYQYRSLFPRLITDWRRQFHAAAAPFIFVQLANHKSPSAVPAESMWAELREAQTMALTLENTAMANAIDIGEAGNIHPKNKQEVGRRLALLARKITYGKNNLLAAGPVFKKTVFKNNTCLIYFTNEGNGLKLKDSSNEVKEFAIATDGSHYFAKAIAKINSKNSIVVSSPDGRPITAIRYAWANNPAEVNLMNSDGLPAYPFRTDDFTGLTYNKRYNNK